MKTILLNWLVYLGTMFTISKQTITAQVSLINGYIRITPLEIDYRFQKEQTAILSNIRILSQLFLGKTAAFNSNEMVMAYFIQNGWKVVAND